MICIKDEDQYKSEILDFEGIYCLLFSKEDSPPCLVMERQLSALCSKHSIRLFKIDCISQDSYPIVVKHSVGMLPKYIFIKGNKVLYENSGTEVNRVIEKQIKIWSKVL